MQSSYRPESNSVVRRSTRNKAEARLARNRLESTRKENQDGFSSYSGPPTVRDPETHLDVTPKPFDDEDDVKKPNNSRKSHGTGRALTEEASQMGILSSYANASPDASENLEDSNSQASIEPSATESTSGLDSVMSKRAKSSTDELSIDRMSSQHATDGSSAIHPTTSISEMNKSSNRRRDSIAIRRTSYNRLKEMTAEERFYWGLQEVSVALKETPTFMIFERPDEAAMKHTKSYEINELNNARYIKLKESIPGSDRYANKGIITLNPPLKTTETSAFVPELKTPGSGQQTESWRVDDETRILYDDENDDEMPHHNLNIPSADPEGSVNINSDRLTVDEEPIDEAQDDQGTVLDGREEEEGMSKTDNAEVGLRKKDQAWIHNPSVIQTLTILERIVVGNIFESRQLQYRGTGLEVGLDPFCTASVTLEGNRKSISSTDGNERNSRENVSSMQQNSRRSRISGSLEQKKNQKANHLNASKIEMTKLWKYASDVTRNRNVTSIAWNPRNSDILAASYGDYGIRITSSETNRVPEVQGGMICCWSLKNPTFPERIIQTDFGGLGITSVQFSTLHPSLLAAGFTDGSLALFDIRKRGNAPALRTSLGTGQHTGTIWEVCWTQKGKQENLITVGADGRIIEWSLKKGLERASGDLMILKRQQDQMGELLSPYAKGENQRATEALLSRNSGGMCFDFHQDGLFYLVGTEDGTLTKCARSQRDTHVTMYQRHEEPVYRVRWSPWWKDIFVSCSADWTARLYHQDRKCPVLTFHHPQEAVHDITWCPTHSTFIATATSSGRVYLWDISEPLEPISTYRISNDDRILTSIAFNSNNRSTYPILATADNHGEVTILQVRGQKLENQINTEQGTQELIEALKPNMN